MSRRRKKQGKSFQQRQAERKQHEQQRQELDDVLDDMAAKYTCSTETARDFAGQCSDRLDDLEYDLDCSRIARDFWSEAPEHTAPLAEALRELTAEHERHAAVLADLHRRMIELTHNESVHHHLDPPGHYRDQLRLQLFPDPEQRPVQNHAVSGDH